MITRQRSLTLFDTYPLERIGKLEKLLFFDIETTGFSGEYSNLYLIGCAYYKNNSWNLIQWFADTAEAEAQLLHHFFGFMKDYQILIHFNGDSFDIPYVNKRCAKLGLPYTFSDIESFDIYKKCKPYRKLLGLESMKQKSIEHFLGIHRQDKLNGGQLIDVYKEYLFSHADLLYDMLILHNAEDLEGMPLCLPILNYPDFFQHELTYAGGEQKDGYLNLYLNSRYTLPVDIKTSKEPVLAIASGNSLTLFVKLYEGVLKHYYSNYKDYYYLIYEDMAIHKSVGEYVDKGARLKATAKTCYIKKDGCFLPQFSPLWEPVLKKAPRDKICYTEYSSACLSEEACLKAYLRQLLEWLGVSAAI